MKISACTAFTCLAVLLLASASAASAATATGGPPHPWSAAARCCRSVAQLGSTLAVTTAEECRSPFTSCSLCVYERTVVDTPLASCHGVYHG